MIKCLLVAHLLSLVTSQSPPLQVGDANQFLLVKLNHTLKLSCPYTDVDFYKWNNLKMPTPYLSDHREITVTLNSYRKIQIYECEAVNGYGKKTALFMVKGIDTKSKQFEIDCQRRETGPCFLVPGLSNDFEYVVDENKNVSMDCRALLNSSVKDSLTYSWKKVTNLNSFEFRNSIKNDGIRNTVQLLDDTQPKGKFMTDSIHDISKWGSIVTLKNVTKDVEGIYTCMVSSSTSSIKRTFKLQVKVVKISRYIDGPEFQNILAPVGSTRILDCKADSKPKWGKKLDSRDETTDNEEIIKWGGSSYRMLQGSLDIEHRNNDGTVKDSKYYMNNLKLENLQISHSGIYVCTVLTSLNLEYKYVNLTVEIGSGYNDSSKKSNNFPIYIAVPTTVFIICLATIIYCLIHRRIRQKANFKNRVVRGTTVTTTNSSSGNGSYSGSKNTSNPRHHMLTATTSSSKGSQNQFSPNSCNSYSGNITSVSGYGSNHPTFSSGYVPSTVNYNYNAAGPYIQATNNTPCSTDIDHPCSHHSCNPHNGHAVPYDFDSTPSPPPPTSIEDTVSLSVINVGNQIGIAPYSITGVSINSYSPNQSSQPYMPSQTPQGSSSTSASSPNAMYTMNQQQPVYPVGIVYSA